MVQQSDHLVAQRLAGVGWLSNVLAVDPRAQVIKQFNRRLDAEVGLDQQRFQILVEVLGDLAAFEECADIFEDAAARLFQASFDFWFGLALPAKEPAENHDHVLTAGAGSSIRNAAPEIARRGATKVYTTPKQIDAVDAGSDSDKPGRWSHFARMFAPDIANVRKIRHSRLRPATT